MVTSWREIADRIGNNLVGGYCNACPSPSHDRAGGFCNSSAHIAHVSPMRLQCERQQRAIVNLGKIPEINVNPTSAQCQTDGRRAGLKIRSSQEGVGSSPTFGNSDSR